MKALFAILCFLLCFQDNIFAQGKVALVFDTSWKAIDTLGKIIARDMFSPNEELWYNSFKDGLLLYRTNNKFGLKDLYGNILIPPQFDHIELCNGGFAKTIKAYKYGLVNKVGRTIFDCTYDYISNVTANGKVAIVLANKIGLADTTGTIFSPFLHLTDTKIFTTLEFENGLLPVITFENIGFRLNGAKMVGFINDGGEMVIQPKFPLSGGLRSRHDDLRDAMFEGGMCGTGFHAASESAKQNPYYLKKDYYQFKSKRCLVGLNTVIDEKGSEIFKISGYAASIENLNGYFKVDRRPSGHWAKYTTGRDTLGIQFYDRNGKLVVTEKNTEIITCWNRYLLIKTIGQEEYKFIDTSTGSTAFNTIFRAVWFGGVDPDNSLYAYTNKGTIDTFGNLQDEEHLGASKNGFTSFKQREKYGFKNAVGKIVIPAVYNQVRNFELLAPK
ncbi:MAG: WG repeat-containing protein [Bacteroidota bacterium]